MKTVTGREIYEAIKKNGYPWIQGTYITRYNDEIQGACALGQASLNLGVDIGKTMAISTNEANFNGTFQPLHPFFPYNVAIATANDGIITTEHPPVVPTYAEIVAEAEMILTPVFDETFEFEELE